MADGEDDAYERHKRRAAKRQSELSQDAREIEPLPKVVDPIRKESCRLNFRLFLETYFASTFNLAWSEDHLKVITYIERVVLGAASNDHGEAVVWMGPLYEIACNYDRWSRDEGDPSLSPIDISVFDSE